MKKIFKKNQVIITALALMLCAAGYLQFSDAGAENGKEEAGGYEYNLADNKSEDEQKENGSSVTIHVGSMQDINKTAENDTEESENHQVGDAVMVSTTLQANFTTNARLVREQRRAQSKETLMAIIDNQELSEEQKQGAVETLVNLTTIAEKENAAELLLEAKGFADPIVNISENEVDVVINASSVTDQQIAQIEDIVMRKTGYEVEDITITAAIQED